MAESESWKIPDERDQIHAPQHGRPDLRCHEHDACYELIHALLGRVMQLESRVTNLEEK
jgi:hypothetical protein